MTNYELEKELYEFGMEDYELGDDDYTLYAHKGSSHDEVKYDTAQYETVQQFLDENIREL